MTPFFSANQHSMTGNVPKFATLFQSNPVANVLFSTESTIVDVNAAYCQLTGFTPEELIGQTTFGLKLMSLEDRARMHATVQKAGGVLSGFEFDLRRRDGSLRSILASSTPMTVKGQLHRLGTFIDITERKLAEVALDAEKERLRVTLISIGDGVITTDTQGRVVLVNEVAERLTGWRSDEACGKCGFALTLS